MSSNAGPDIVQDGLVFKYDTGDGKSYKGEPTTNVVSQPFNLSSGYSKGTGMETASGTTLNFTGGYNASTITRPSTDVSNWIAYTGAVEGEASGVQFTTTWYLKAGSISSVYVSWGGAHTGNRTNLTVNLNTGAVTGVTLASGEFYRVRAEENGYYAIEYSSTLTGTNYFPQLTLNSAGFIYFGGIQIEQKSHATPFINGTRSATESLIDRTGNTTIDLSDVSFDSNAQMTFDGTDDYVSTGSFDMGTPTDITLDCWIKFNGSLDSNDRKVMHYDKTGTSNAVFQLRKGTSNGRLMYQAHNGSQWYTMYDDDAIESDTWAHFTITHAGTSAIMYKNGIQTVTATMGNLDWTNANNLLIGYRVNSEYWKGDINIMRIYNRALTAKEVLQNYRATRSRFS